jgi:RimJ/RimL family protein N-acetyltransferase
MADTPMDLIAGRYVKVREMREADAALVVEWRNRDDVKKWLIRWEPLTVDAQLRWFRGARAQGDMLFMFESIQGAAVGTGSIYGLDRPRTCAQWGRLCAAQIAGSALSILEACYLVHRICFEILGMRRLYGSLTSDNKSSYRLNRFLGYVEEGRRRKHFAHPDGYKDVIELGLLAEEFRQERSSIEPKLYRHQPAPEIATARADLIRKILSRE